MTELEKKTELKSNAHGFYTVWSMWPMSTSNKRVSYFFQGNRYRALQRYTEKPYHSLIAPIQNYKEYINTIRSDPHCYPYYFKLRNIQSSYNSGWPITMNLCISTQ